MIKLLKNIAKLLVKKHSTLSVCESCTGGMLGNLITSVTGSSNYFLGGIIAYSNEVKERVAGVKAETLRKYGAVSAETAREMAQGVRRRLKSDIGISITGVAGPTGGTKKKPVGLVYIAIVNKKNLSAKKFFFKGSRVTVRKKACARAVVMLDKFLAQSNRDI